MNVKLYKKVSEKQIIVSTLLRNNAREKYFHDIINRN